MLTSSYTFKDRVIKFFRKILAIDRPDLVLLFMMLGLSSAIPIEFYVPGTSVFVQFVYCILGGLWIILQEFVFAHK